MQPILFYTLGAPVNATQIPDPMQSMNRLGNISLARTLDATCQFGSPQEKPMLTFGCGKQVLCRKINRLSRRGLFLRNCSYGVVPPVWWYAVHHCPGRGSSVFLVSGPVW